MYYYNISIKYITLMTFVRLYIISYENVYQFTDNDINEFIILKCNTILTDKLNEMIYSNKMQFICVP